MRRPIQRPIQRTALVFLASALLGSLLPLAVQAPVSAADQPAYRQTQELDRTFVNGDRTVVIDERKVTVTVDRTQDFRGRERVNIAWTGAHPTGGRSASPFGEQGLAQEYPVVILQCRGVENPAKGQEQLARETCWTSTRMQRSQMVNATQAGWLNDLYADEEQRQLKYGLDPIPDQCQDAESFATRITAFKAANGTTYASCTAETMPPEAAVGAAFPPAEMAAFTGTDGTGSAQFEVRSAVENESLGCSATVACSIVVIPIQGLSCEGAGTACRRGGQFAPGSSNFAGLGVDLAVSPALWWAESNWRGRFSVPITFGLDPDACNVLDDRAPTGFYGSELLSQAALQWSPAYCLRNDRFKFQHNRMADGAAFALMENGGGVAALVSSEHERTGSDPVGYAPTAVTGFAVGYVVDRPDNAGETKTLKLNARLVAKLITQSYPASDRGRGRPGLEQNPLSINLDPEFQKLNPGLDRIARESAATIISLSEESDVLAALTAYVANDPEAAAFVSGKADPWGMKVNPAYRGIELPRAEWPLLDDYVPPTNQECYAQNPSPYLAQVAAPVTQLHKIAEAVLDGWPNVQTKCERSTMSDPWKIGRVDRQGVGTRFVLGLVSLGDAARFGLQTAALETRSGRYVRPSTAGLAEAVKVATAKKSGTGPFTLAMDDVVAAGGAYPGTMVVHTAARMSGLQKSDAAKVAQFIRVSSSEGQRAGYGNGQLPGGYLPITRKGATAALYAQAQTVADRIEEQRGLPTPKPKQTDEPEATDEPGPDMDPVPELPDTAPVADDVPAAPDVAPATGDQLVVMPPTTQVSSPTAAKVLPMLLGAIFAAGLLAGAGRAAIWSQRRPQRSGGRV